MLAGLRRFPPEVRNPIIYASYHYLLCCTIPKFSISKMSTLLDVYSIHAPGVRFNDTEPHKSSLTAFTRAEEVFSPDILRSKRINGINSRFHCYRCFRSLRRHLEFFTRTSLSLLPRAASRYHDSFSAAAFALAPRAFFSGLSFFSRAAWRMALARATASCRRSAR